MTHRSIRLTAVLGGFAALAMLGTALLGPSPAAGAKRCQMPRGKKIGADQVAAVECATLNAANLRKSVFAEEKRLFESCVDQASLPPEDQDWTVIEQSAADHERFARTTLKASSVKTFQALAAYLQSFLDEYRDEDPLPAHRLSVTISRLKSAAHHYTVYAAKEVEVGAAARNHDCAGVNKARKAADSAEGDGNADVNEAVELLEAIAKGD
jgi:hypothetical protein